MVRVNNILSREQVVKYGVPQGTVLGPLLFLIYINGMFDLPSCGSVIAFADDTAVFYEADSWITLKNKIEKDFKVIKQWLDAKLLTINWSKTCYIPFTLYKDRLPEYNCLEVKTDDDHFFINSSNRVKYLGVYVDTHLKWDYQVQYLKQKLRGLLFRFKKLKCILDTHHMKALYHALVESQLNYGILGWGGVRKTLLNQLESLQRRFLKIIYNKPQRYSSDLLYKHSEVLDIRLCYARSLLRYQYKGKSSAKRVDHQQNTRLRMNECLSTMRSNKEIGKRYFSYIAPRIFNSIPTELKTINSIALFLNKIKKWLLTCDRHCIRALLDLD